MSSADRFVISQAGLEPQPASYPKPPPNRYVPWEQGDRRPERPIYPPPPEPTDQVQVFATAVVLWDRARSSPLSKVVRGDLARLPDGRIFARYRDTLSDGSFAFGYAEFDLERDITTPLPLPTDWAGRLAFRLQEGGGPTFFHELTAPPRGENDKLCDEYPTLAEQLGITRTPVPAALFSTGRIRYPKVLHRSAGLIPELGYWRGLISDHSQGHWGLAGEFQDVAPLTEVELWTADELPIAVQNALAVKTGLGAVRSYYRLPEGAAAVLREHAPWQSQPPPPVIAVLTVLGRGGETLLSVAPLPG
jgi:hypothetical protein